MTDNMDDKVVEAVETLVRVKVAKALEKDDALIENMVIKILEGKHLRDNPRKTYIEERLEYRVNRLVEEEIGACLKEEMDAIKSAIHAKAKPIMDKLVEQVINHFDSEDWRIKFDIHLGDR